MARVEGEDHKSTEMGLHEEQLEGRTQQMFFRVEGEEERFQKPFDIEVDFDKQAEIDAENLSSSEVNKEIKRLMLDGYGSITIRNPGAKHSMGVGFLNRLNLTFDGSLGYFGCGLLDGPNVRITGRVGWSCGENMMSGRVVIEKNAGSTFGAAMRGGDLVVKGSVGSRTGIDQKGGTIIVGGDAGAFTGFMMQRGRMIILGDAGKNLGDTMYDGLIYVAGNITELGVDCVETEMTDLDKHWLENKLGQYGLEAPNGVANMTKLTSGKKLWNYDNLEPTEKKLVL
jgi:glutamate synthase domain-containing protein 3